MTQTRSEKESARRLSDCITELIKSQPFFGSLALRLPLRPDYTRKTLASDGREIRYNPDWTAQSDAHVIQTAIARVVFACALKHHTRRGDRDPDKWQHASQLVTHSILRDSDFILPANAECIDGHSVEEAYDLLPPPDPDGDDRPGDDDALPSGGAPPPGMQEGDSSPETDPGAGQGTPTEGGTGDESQSHDPAGTGEVMDAPAKDSNDDARASPSEIKSEEQAWDQAMHQASNLAKAEGKLPGSVKETLENAHKSVVDWRTLFRRFMLSTARRDYSWSTPNRRFICEGLYLPSLRSDGMDTLAVIIDTSASLPSRILSEFWSELTEIAAEIRPDNIVVLLVDVRVRDASFYTPYDLPAEMDARGRGGTDFRPGFEWLDEHAIRPGACVYFTDMECSSYPENEPPYPVLWINWSTPPGESEREPWGERIDVGES